jgi:hypothetical protein
VDITTTNSANGSAFFDVKQNGISRFKVVKNSGATTAQIIINGGDANPCSFTCVGNSLSIAPEGNQNVTLTNGFSVTRNGGGAATTGGTITSTQTWNSIASTFTGFTVNVTDTNSNAASLLMDLQVGGSTRFSISKNGALAFGSSTNPVLRASVSSDGAGRILLNSTNSGGATVYGSLGIGGNNDTILARDAANTLAQRNGTAAQTSRIYGTFTARGAGTTSLEALEIKSQSAGSVIIQSLKGSAGGTARDIELRHGAVDTNGVITNGTLVATVKSTGLETTNLTASGTVTAGNGAFGNWTLGVDILATTPGGSVQVSGVGSFRFGGAGERIYNSGSAIKIRNAANTLDAALTCSSLTASGDIEVTDSTKGIILKSPSGTRYRFTVSDLGTLTPTAL